MRSASPPDVDPATTTFVFVTPRRWSAKATWAAECRREGRWRDVRAYDGDDLEAWLDLAPAVHIWVSTLLGKRPEGATDADTFWADWSQATWPALTPDVVLAGRGEIVERVRAWLEAPAAPLGLRADSRDEARAVFVAALQSLSDEVAETARSRAVIATTAEACTYLAATTSPLILVVAFEDEAAVSRATRAGHRIVVPAGRGDPASGAIDIPRLSRQEATKAFAACGIEEGRAHDLAGTARRSLCSLRRRLARSPGLQQPAWARPENARSLLPAMLAGTWEDGRDGDRAILSRLADLPYPQLNGVHVRWASSDDPPLRLVGRDWCLNDTEDAWSLLSRYLQMDDLKRMEEAALQVLGAADPRFDLPENQRWMAQALGNRAPHSTHLRKGLAQTLALMGSRDDGTLPGVGVSAGSFAARTVRQVLERAQDDWRAWASLSGLLPLLAEAAPDEFLSAVEKGLRGADPLLLRLFSDREGAPFPSSEHTGLLWALETLCWSPVYLGRAALLLAMLARLDPGGKLSNRPSGSLREVFLLWRPQTAADLGRRLGVLDRLREREPDVAWSLLMALLPGPSEWAMGTHKPRFRDWVAEPPRPLTCQDVAGAVKKIASRLLADVGESGARWVELIKVLA